MSGLLGSGGRHEDRRTALTDRKKKPSLNPLRYGNGRFPYVVIAGLVLVGLYISLSHWGLNTSLEAIQNEGRLVVVTRNSPTTYYLGRDGTPEGFEVDLATSFAATLGAEVQVDFLEVDTVPEIFQAIENGDAHIAAAGLTVTQDRADAYRFAPSYNQVKQVVVCRKEGTPPESPDELVGRAIVVTDGSSHVAALESLAPEIEGLEWIALDAGPETLMLRVWEKDHECTIVDEPVFQVTRRHYPELIKAFALTEDEPLAWVIAPGADELGDAADAWFARESTAKEIDRLTASHFGFFPKFDYLDMIRFRRDIEEILPKYERDFRTGARRNDIPWRLLAAKAYQESKWNPDAVSPTGVRGIMMLTRSTAERVGVEDRTDPQESIWGGARYFADLLSRVPDEVEGEDRYWFALAAYNMGLGHVYDARTLAERRGLDKNVWVDVKKVLGSLSDEKVYPTLRYGYARGYEARRHVEQVRTYWHVLKEQR